MLPEKVGVPMGYPAIVETAIVGDAERLLSAKLLKRGGVCDDEGRTVDGRRKSGV